MNKILKWILILILIYICGGTTLFVWNMASCCGCTIEPLFKSCEQSEIVYKYDVKATLDNPLFISREVQLKKGKEKLLNVGYYNVHQFELKNVKLALSECMSQDGTIRLFYDDPTIDPFYIVSKTETVGSSKKIGYKIKLIDKTKELELGEEFPTGSYVCKIVVYAPEISTGLGSLQEPYEEKQFFLTVLD
ncbi:hypothetical protein HN695_05120 [Candidatus Woesearchaeota archaeon]|jgi:hypothetical protein|nr:hypothetical protein [Candidatus Woesearchaeota archaeon]MBT5272512.1 hypothetical protein [Candidatus Woesearchaeota archaeon]MBT6041480.1 hypothetical protein [Candidatus Woesearchaeota archaeon]MBT6336374.1 hypothetical protein [Candidatus Woesearchaeota archaeon]MBT7927695.1 hypothetical protein [Candidatus Woesearchaeota archaeon]